MTRAAIVLTPAGGLASAEVPRDAKASVDVGQRLVVTAALDFGPYGLVLKGDTARVTYTNLGSGEVQITVDRYIPAMCAWENTFTLMPFETDELLGSLQMAAQPNSLAA